MDTELTMCEKEAIERAQKGDPAGWGHLYELHRHSVFSFCLRHTQNRSDAEDLTQDIFIHVFRKLCSFRGESQFTSWLYTLTLNFVRLHARRQRQNGRFLTTDPSDNCLGLLQSQPFAPARRLALVQALNMLTAARRSAVLLYDIEGCTHNESARRLGISVIASKSRVHHAHIAMRTYLGTASTHSN